MELKKVEKTLTIDGIDYSVNCTLFLGRSGLALAVKLVKLILPMMSKLKIKPSDVADKKLAVKDFSFSPELLSDILNELARMLDDNKVMDLIIELTKNVEVNGMSCGRQESFDIIFQGNLTLLFEVVRLVIVENFAPFLKQAMSIK